LADRICGNGPSISGTEQTRAPAEPFRSSSTARPPCATASSLRPARGAGTRRLLPNQRGVNTPGICQGRRFGSAGRRGKRDIRGIEHGRPQLLEAAETLQRAGGLVSKRLSRNEIGAITKEGARNYERPCSRITTNCANLQLPFRTSCVQGLPCGSVVRNCSTTTASLDPGWLQSAGLHGRLQTIVWLDMDFSVSDSAAARGDFILDAVGCEQTACWTTHTRSSQWRLCVL